MPRGGWRPVGGRKFVDPTGKRLVRRRVLITEAQDKMLEALARQQKVSPSAIHRRLIDLVFQGVVVPGDLDGEEGSPDEACI